MLKKYKKTLTWQASSNERTKERAQPRIYVKLRQPTIVYFNFIKTIKQGNTLC